MKAYILENKERFLNELKDFLRIPSISADPFYALHIEKAADFVYDELQKAGMRKIHKFYTGGNPIVYGEKIISEDLPTVLYYGHYDVQPADPIDLWDSEPFEPLIKDGKIVCRGASDDKSQVFLIIKTIEVMHQLNEQVCNVKVIFEGEEETGSQSLERFLLENRSMLQADTFVVCDTAMPKINQPALITSLRGICYCEISVSGAPNDVHSGMMGGAIINPLQVLCTLISKLKDENNTILIPGFYEGVYCEKNENDEHVNQFPENLLPFLSGEKGFSLYDQLTLRPTLDVNGIWGGYSGQGPKTIIPAQAFAKISMRLVEGQDHNEIAEKLSVYLQESAPEQVHLEVKQIAGCNAVITSKDNDAFMAAKLSLAKIFGKAPLHTKIGGSIPVVSLIKEYLNIEPVLMGFSLDEDNIHAPNESFLLDNFYRGIETLIDFMQVYSQIFSSKEEIEILIKS